MIWRPVLYVAAALLLPTLALAAILLAARCGSQSEENGDQP